MASGKQTVNMTTRKMPFFADYRYAIPTVNFTENVQSYIHMHINDIHNRTQSTTSHC